MLNNFFTYYLTINQYYVMIQQNKQTAQRGDACMKKLQVFSVLSLVMALSMNTAFATTSSQILVMSSQLYQIARDLTTGIFPTSILLIAIGTWGLVNAFGKGIGDGIHQLINIIAVGGIVFFAASLLANAALFSAQL
jgi:hypothetical protein